MQPFLIVTFILKNAQWYLLSHFLMFALCRCCLIHSMDASKKPEVEQKAQNTSVQEQPTHKRVPKRCSKCGKSVVNLSRHQKDVHGMKKLKRKLSDYFMGMKRKPKGTVRFWNRTPIFQLHKHLQTSIHDLRPNTPSYTEPLLDGLISGWVTI